MAFFGQKQPKLTKNEENRQNPNRLMKSFEIWYVDASQQTKKMLQKPFFYFGLFRPFFNLKAAKIDKKWRKLAKSKPFDEIFWNLVCRYFQTKKCYKNLFLDFGLFWPFFNQKTAKIDQKWKKLTKSKPFDKIFWNLVYRRSSTKTKCYKKLYLDFGLFWPFLTKKQQKK